MCSLSPQPGNSAGVRRVATDAAAARARLLGLNVSPRQILGSLLRELAFAQSGGLADLDQVAVGVPHIAADLRAAIDRRRHEFGPLRAPALVARLNVGYAQVHEARDRVG